MIFNEFYGGGMSNEYPKRETVAIYHGPFAGGWIWDETNYATGKNVGGSEVWAIRLSQELSKLGYMVFIFANPESFHVDKFGVFWCKAETFKSMAKIIHFDHLLSSRRVDEIDDSLDVGDISVMLHENYIIRSTTSTFQSLFPKIKNIYFQADTQRVLLTKKFSVPEDKIRTTIEGVDMDLYKDAPNIQKKNKMLWSMCVNKGADLLVEKIFPLIRAEVPDFEIVMCHYHETFNDPKFKKEGIIIRNDLDRVGFIREQMESKIFIYPNWGRTSDKKYNYETFSITTVENVMAMAAPVLGDFGCWHSTLRGYTGFVGNGLFKDILTPLSEEDRDKFCEELAKEAIRLLKEEDYRIERVKEAMEICKGYTWSAVAQTFVDGWK